MSSAFWRALFELRDFVDRAAERAAGQLRSGQSEREATSRSALVLSTLHMDVRHALDRHAVAALEGRFPAHEGDRAVERALRLLSFWLNERIRRRLPAGDRADWQPVGPAGVDLRQGGRAFFLELDELLSELGSRAPGRRAGGASASSETLADLALFCLEEGFTGEHATSPRALEEYRSRLRRPLPDPVVMPAPATALAGVPRAPRVVAACGVCLLFYACCLVGFDWLGGS